MNKSSFLPEIDMPRSKRGELSIIESILRSVKNDNELKTHISYDAMIDSRTIGRYMPMLVGMGLVKTKQKGKYKITKKGLQFLRKYGEIKKYDGKVT